jgi:hypothetical protein
MVERTGAELSLFDRDSNLLASWPESSPLRDGPRPELRIAARSRHGFDRRERAPQSGVYLNVAVAYPSRDEGQLEGFIRLAEKEQEAITLDSRLQQLLWLFGLSLAGLAAAVMWAYARRDNTTTSQRYSGEAMSGATCPTLFAICKRNWNRGKADSRKTVSGWKLS